MCLSKILLKNANNWIENESFVEDVFDLNTAKT